MSTNIADHEVELRAILTNAQRHRVVRALRSIGATQRGVEALTDVYFCPRSVRSFKAIEMDEIGSFSLRLRTRRAGGISTSNLNIKVITRRGDHHAWEEHESGVGSFDEMKHILTTVGFKPFFTMKKQRRTYVRGRFTAVVEDIAGFGPIIEVEVLTSKRDAPRAKLRIHAFLESIGVQASQIVPKSVTNLLMHKMTKF
ncbi:MAG: class IV adenylate cyclase [Candidatus Kerfeldbacteria bacterium]|nr:class IV adenylate cyclase [Candidatus Kerfeldbacteria bacterium]